MGDTPIGWNPTPEQFDRYLQREVEMARRNLARPNTHHATTLHSPETIWLAKQKS